MKKVFVSGPLMSFGGYHYNLGYAARVAHELHKRGFAVYCPHLESAESVRYQDIPSEEHWKNNALMWLEVSDIVLFLPFWDRSTGACEEHEHADNLMIPKFYIPKSTAYEEIGDVLDMLLMEWV